MNHIELSCETQCIEMSASGGIETGVPVMPPSGCAILVKLMVGIGAEHLVLAGASAADQHGARLLLLHFRVESLLK